MINYKKRGILNNKNNEEDNLGDGGKEDGGRQQPWLGRLSPQNGRAGGEFFIYRYRHNKCKFGYEKRPTLLQLFFEKNPNFKISTGGGGEAQRG